MLKPTRMFLVGCPRSGTSLLQSMLVAHSQILSFPETSFFCYMSNNEPLNLQSSSAKNLSIYLLRSLRRQLGLARPRPMSETFHKLLSFTDRQDLSFEVPKQTFFIKGNALSYVRILDQIAQGKEKKAWLDKSPCHIFCINTIERYVNEVRFLHIIRNGADVVASLYDAAKKYGGHNWSKYNDLDHCIRTWNACAKISLKYSTHKNHKIVSYTHLLKDPVATLTDICQFMDLDFDESMLQERTQSIALITEKHEARTYKSSLYEPIKSMDGTKFMDLFSEKQRAYILERLINIDSLFSSQDPSQP